MQILSVMRLVGMVESVKAQVSQQARRLASAAAFGAVGLLVAFLGLLFVSMAAMLGLATEWPMYWAALTVGGVLLLIAAILFYLAAGSRKMVKPKIASPPPPPPGRPNPELMEALHKAEILTRRNPGVATLGAIGLGLVVGFLAGGKKSDGNR